MHLHAYILAKGNDAEDAESIVRCFIEEQVGESRWFDYGDIDETPGVRTLPLYAVRKELKSSLEYVYNVTLQKFLEMFDKARVKIPEDGKTLYDSNTSDLGYPASRITAICYQEFKDDMPFFNREDYSWLLPGEDEDGLDKDGQAWYAVPVDLHF